jgi:hypothetical protein
MEARENPLTQQPQSKSESESKSETYTTETRPFPGWPHVGGGSGDAPAAPVAGGDGGDAGEAGGEGGEGGEPAITDLIAAAAEFDAEAVAGEHGGDPDADPAAGDGEGDGKKAAQPAVDDPLQEYIDKYYGGSKQAFVAAQFESRAEGKRLAQELADLKATLAAKPRDMQAEINEALKADPEVLAIDQEYQAIVADTKATNTRQTQITADYAKSNAEVISLEAELKHVDDPKESGKLQTKIMQLRMDLANLNSEFRENQTKLNMNARDARRLEREMVNAQKAVRDRLEHDDRTKQTSARSEAKTLEAFNKSFTYFMAPFALDPKSEQYEDIMETVKARLATKIEERGEDADPLDASEIAELTAGIITKFAKANGLKPKAPGTKPGTPTPPKPPARPVSQRQVVLGNRARPTAPADGGNGGAPRGSAAPRTAEDVNKNPDLIRARADRIFSAAAQNNAIAQGRGLRRG